MTDQHGIKRPDYHSPIQDTSDRPLQLQSSPTVPFFIRSASHLLPQPNYLFCSLPQALISREPINILQLISASEYVSQHLEPTCHSKVGDFLLFFFFFSLSFSMQSITPSSLINGHNYFPFHLLILGMIIYMFLAVSFFKSQLISGLPY